MELGVGPEHSQMLLPKIQILLNKRNWPQCYPDGAEYIVNKEDIINLPSLFPNTWIPKFLLQAVLKRERF